MGLAAPILYGELRSCKWIAEHLAKPDAARSVDDAMASDPVPILIPHHGGLKTDGGPRGYSVDLARKESLLALERWRAPYAGHLSTRIFVRRARQAERRIRKGNRVRFRSPEDALTGGYGPSGVCRPA